MLTRSRLTALITLLTSLVVCAPAFAAPPLEQVAVNGTDLGDGTFAGVAQCPEGQRVISGGYVTQDGKTAMINHATGKRGWFAVALGVSGLQITANCSDTLKVDKVIAEGKAGPNRLGNVKAKCPRGQSIVSGGWEYLAGNQNSPVFSSAPKDGRTWKIVAAADSRDTIAAFGYCLKGTDVTQKVGKGKPAPEEADAFAKASCKRAKDLLGGGFLTSPKPDFSNNDGPDTFFGASQRSGEPWLVRAHNFSPVTGTIKAVATCLD